MWCGSPGPLIVDTMMIPSRSTHRERRQVPRTCLEGLVWSSRFLGFLELSLHCLWFEAAFHHTTLLLASPGPLTLTFRAPASAQFDGALGFITLPGSFVALPAKGPCYVRSWGLGNDCLSEQRLVSGLANNVVNASDLLTFIVDSAQKKKLIHYCVQLGITIETVNFVLQKRKWVWGSPSQRSSSGRAPSLTVLYTVAEFSLAAQWGQVWIGFSMMPGVWTK